MRIEFRQVGLLAIAIAVGACSSSNSSSDRGQGGGTQSAKGGSGPSGGATGSGQGGGSSSQGGSTGTPQGGSTSANGGGSSTGQGGGSSSNGGSSSSNGGSTSGGSSSANGGSTSTGNVPAGYWTYKDWHGCVWTGVDTVTVAPHKSTITPTDFTMQAGTSGPYHVSGTVGQDPKWGGTALLGFNLAQPAEGASCVYNASAATSAGPPEVAFASGSAGIAVNFSKTGSTGVVRIQIQGQKGATDANNRWCYTLTQTQGKDFAPFNRFFTQCWNDDGTGKSKSTTDSIGTAYNGEKISAIVFNVPGDSAKDLPFDFTVNGFALGNSAADAPDGGTLGSLSGTIGGADTGSSTDHDFQRVKVNAGGHSYIIQNNNWGNPTNSVQTLSYKDNSFTITEESGSDPAQQGGVRSFPSIFIGSNGNTMSGAYSTYNDDSLPIKVSAIQSVQTTLKWGGGVGGGNYNVSYDVWFGPTPAAKFPFYSEYKDGQSGFIMVWLYKPSQNNPIGGSPAASNRTVAGVSGTWNVYAGPRGGSGPNSGVPVISYVATSTLQSMTFDLNNFIKDAVSTGAGGLKISQDSYLTDVFAGFEIWNGNDAKGLSVQEFTAVVK